MRVRTVIAGTGIVLAGMIGLAPLAGADPAGEGPNWGSVVKSYNPQGPNSYPSGGSRGTFVAPNARPTDTAGPLGPGYGREIHDAANPGGSDPNGGPLN